VSDSLSHFRRLKLSLTRLLRITFMDQGDSNRLRLIRLARTCAIGFRISRSAAFVTYFEL